MFAAVHSHFSEFEASMEFLRREGSFEDSHMFVEFKFFHKGIG